MKIAIITSVPHKIHQDQLWSYGPYVKEMNLWGKHVSGIILVAPETGEMVSEIDVAYQHADITHKVIPSISLTSFSELLRTLVRLPGILSAIFGAMRRADHIHLRCPGNIGMLGAMVQIFFPGKPKTAKYAGNWDPSARQPRSYRFQKWLLGNTFWTKNMQVLVYGDWPGQSKNIKPFFTATYPESKTAETVDRCFESPYRFLFVGTLSPGKQPTYVVQLIDALRKRGKQVRLDMYGEGVERDAVEKIIAEKNLGDVITLHGNQSAGVVEEAYKQSHMMLLPSKSEGWPKVVAEAMFWGCLPVVTRVSCVPWMLGEGERGVLLSEEKESDVKLLNELLNDPEAMQRMSETGMQWSRAYTIDAFEREIKKLLV